jgi:hypothetical protein
MLVPDRVDATEIDGLVYVYVDMIDFRSIGAAKRIVLATGAHSLLRSKLIVSTQSCIKRLIFVYLSLS